MTKKVQSKKETAVLPPTATPTLPPENPAEVQCNTEILLEKILEACREVKLSVDELARKFGGGY